MTDGLTRCIHGKTQGGGTHHQCRERAVLGSVYCAPHRAEGLARVAQLAPQRKREGRASLAWWVR